MESPGGCLAKVWHFHLTREHCSFYKEGYEETEKMNEISWQATAVPTRKTIYILNHFVVDVSYTLFSA